VSTSRRTERAGANETRSLLALEREAAELDASRALGVLRRRWPVVLIVPIVFALLGYVMAAQRDEVYESSAYVVVRSTVGDSQFAQIETANDDRNIQTETQIINGAAFAQSVSATLGRPADYDAGPVFGTSVIRVTGRGPDGATAAATANAVAERYVAQRRESIVKSLTAANAVLSSRVSAVQAEIDQVNTQIAQLSAQLFPPNASTTNPNAANSPLLSTLQARQASLLTEQSQLRNQLGAIEVSVAVTSGGAQVSAAALPSSDPVAPKPMRSAVLFGMFGVLAGVAAAIALEQLTDVVGRADRFESQLPGVPVLASVPALGAPHTGVLLLQAPQSASAEAVRTLRTSLQFLAIDRPLRRIQVTSATDDEGASVVAANLAVAFAGAGLRVVVLDGDLRDPVLHTSFGVDGMRGFTSALVTRGDIGEFLQPIAMQGWLRVLTAGPRPTNPSELLASGGLSNLLAALEERCDLVIIDSPPVLPYTDAAVVASSVDATILVARPRESKLTSLRRALRTLRVVESNVAGVVLSELEPPVPASSGPRRGAVGATA
jgi:succinoglycan biosynthesis transport protein ExoP